MCGLWGGLSTTLAKGEIEAIRELGMVSSLRGIDSTGIVVGTKKGRSAFRINSHKDTYNPVTFLHTRDVYKLLDGKEPVFVMGHSRWATHGSVNIVNAHPYNLGNIIGMHNGTIDEFKPEKGTEDYRTDSRMLYEIVQKEGIQEALERASKGAWALTWIDTDNKTLNLVRNEKRTLYYSWNVAKNSVFWASEAGFLRLVSERNGNFLQYPVLLPANEIMSFELGSLDYEIQPVRSSKKTQVVVKKLEDEVTKGSALIPFDNTTTNQKYDKFQAPAKKKEALRSYSGFGGHQYGLDFIRQRLANGCSCCGSVYNPEDKGVHWFSYTEWVCEDCKDDKFFNEYANSKQLYEGHLIQ